jgi:hypothetical protein
MASIETSADSMARAVTVISWPIMASGVRVMFTWAGFSTATSTSVTLLDAYET